MRVIGIDPGKTGYIVAIEDRRYDGEWSIPTLNVSKKTNKQDYDVDAMCEILKYECGYRSEIELVVIEKQQAHGPPEGRGSIFTTGRGFGLIEGMVKALGFRYIIPAPKTWQKIMHKDITGDNPKTKSIIVAGRLFPGVDLKRTERCRKPDDNKADALLLAMYGYKYLNELK